MILIMDNPLVSIYIPTRNRHLFLKRALLSVLHQSYSNLEIIIVDDYSQPPVCIPCSLKEKLKLIQTSSPSGASLARNLAISSANGEFILGLDDDDYMYKSRVSDFVRFWFDHDLDVQNCAGIFSPCDGTRIETKRTVDSADLLRQNFVGNQVFTRTNYIKEVGMFNEELLFWQDWDLWQRLSYAKGSLYCLERATQYVTPPNINDSSITKNRLTKCLVRQNVQNFCLNKDFISLKNKENYLYYASAKYNANFSNYLHLFSSLVTAFAFINAIKVLLKCVTLPFKK